MSKYRYKLAFSLTILFYSFVIGFYLFSMPSQLLSVNPKPKEKVMVLALKQFVVPLKIPIEPMPEVQKVLPQEPEPIKPTPKEEVVPPVLTQKVVAKPTPMVVKKREKQKIKKKQKKKIKHKRVIKKPTPKKRKREKAQKRKLAQHSKVSKAKKNTFLAKLRAKINRAKRYPRIAQRRGRQGVVKVRFTLLANGKMGKISMQGPKVFHRSVQKAVNSAFPMSVKNVPFSLPKTFTLSLRYQLR